MGFRRAGLLSHALLIGQVLDPFCSARMPAFSDTRGVGRGQPSVAVQGANHVQLRLCLEAITGAAEGQGEGAGHRCLPAPHPAEVRKHG